MLLDILKIVLPFLGGGAIGALLNELFRRRGARVQFIPLIERVNRCVSPELKGLTLARLTNDGSVRRLEEVKNVREYQFTLRNTSTVHLQDAEIQFEFSTEDVEGWAERPALSKTAPVQVDAVTTNPWKKGYRWRIPHLPSTDSIEFTFRAVNPASNDYEAALYRSDRVVIEKSKGEPSKKRQIAGLEIGQIVVLVIALTLGVSGIFLATRETKSVAAMNEGGCNLILISSYDLFNSNGWPWQGPWQISHHLRNAGTQKCVVQSSAFGGPGNHSRNDWGHSKNRVQPNKTQTDSARFSRRSRRPLTQNYCDTLRRAAELGVCTRANTALLTASSSNYETMTP